MLLGVVKSNVIGVDAEPPLALSVPLTINEAPFETFIIDPDITVRVTPEGIVKVPVIKALPSMVVF